MGHMKTNLTPSEIWTEIKGKAHLYKTAKIKGTEYEYVALLGVRDGTFVVRRIDGAVESYGCQELESFCL